LRLSTKNIKTDESISVHVDVSNIGNLDGEEVVQLYINDVYSSVTTPKKTLKGFKRISIKKGETKQVSFILTQDELAIWDRNMKRTLEPGEFEVMVGGNSVDLIKTKFNVID
jgi:beta-glucosidase